jgi:hypothetical protein
MSKWSDEETDDPVYADGRNQHQSATEPLGSPLVRRRLPQRPNRLAPLLCRLAQVSQTQPPRRRGRRFCWRDLPRRPGRLEPLERIGGLDGRDYAGGHAAENNTLGALDQPFQIGATAGVPTQSLAGYWPASAPDVAR